jgi:hypothetical protein
MQYHPLVDIDLPLTLIPLPSPRGERGGGGVRNAFGEK